MGYLEQIKKLGQDFLDLVFPVNCLVCGKDDIYLCVSCIASLPKLEKQVCLVCQKASPFGKTHPDCVTKNSVDGAVASLTYKNKNVHRLIEVFKYNFVSDLAQPLSDLIVGAIENQGLSDYFKDFLIVPVPLHQRRLNWRGFNQSELLGLALAAKLQIPLTNDLARRRKFTQPQVRLNLDDRKRNVTDAFELTGEVVNQKILLVDDLVTSGSTANELARIFKKGRASEVWIISAAHG